MIAAPVPSTVEATYIINPAVPLNHCQPKTSTHLPNMPPYRRRVRYQIVNGKDDASFILLHNILCVCSSCHNYKSNTTKRRHTGKWNIIYAPKSKSDKLAFQELKKNICKIGKHDCGINIRGEGSHRSLKRKRGVLVYHFHSAPRSFGCTTTRPRNPYYRDTR